MNFKRSERSNSDPTEYGNNFDLVTLLSCVSSLADRRSKLDCPTEQSTLHVM